MQGHWQNDLTTLNSRPPLRRNLGIWGTKMSLSLRAFCGLGIFGIKFRELLMKTTVQNNKNSGNFCIFFIQNSGNFYEKKQLLDVFFQEIPGIFVAQNGKNSGNFKEKTMCPKIASIFA